MAYLHTAQEISDPRADLNDVNPEHVFATVQFGRSYFAVHTAAEAEAFAAAFAESARLLREHHAVVRCGACKTAPVADADERYEDGEPGERAQFCGRCIDRCNDAELAEHRCPVCAP